jgi:hypothetical protein
MNSDEIRLQELTNAHRITLNTFNLILDCDIKGNDAESVSEVKAFLRDIRIKLENDIDETKLLIRASSKEQADGKQDPIKPIDVQ